MHLFARKSTMSRRHANLVAWPTAMLFFLWSSGLGEALFLRARLLNVYANLHAAGLQDRKWQPEQVADAILVTRKQLSSLGGVIVDATEKGDSAAAMMVMGEATKVLRSWNDQDEPIRTAGRMCVLATIALLDGVDDAVASRAWISRAKFDASLRGCWP